MNKMCYLPRTEIFNDRKGYLYFYHTNIKQNNKPFLYFTFWHYWCDTAIVWKHLPQGYTLRLLCIFLTSNDESLSNIF